MLYSYVYIFQCLSRSVTTTRINFVLYSPMNSNDVLVGRKRDQIYHKTLTVLLDLTTPQQKLSPHNNQRVIPYYLFLYDFQKLYDKIYEYRYANPACIVLSQATTLVNVNIKFYVVHNGTRCIVM